MTLNKHYLQFTDKDEKIISAITDTLAMQKEAFIVFLLIDFVALPVLLDQFSFLTHFLVFETNYKLLI